MADSKERKNKNKNGKGTQNQAGDCNTTKRPMQKEGNKPAGEEKYKEDESGSEGSEKGNCTRDGNGTNSYENIPQDNTGTGSKSGAQDDAGTGNNGSGTQDDTGTGNNGSGTQADAGTGNNGSETQDDDGTGNNGSGTQADVGTGNNGSGTQSDAGTGNNGSGTQPDTETGNNKSETQDDAGTGNNGRETQAHAGTGNNGSETQVDAGTGNNGSGTKDDAGIGSNGSGTQDGNGTEDQINSAPGTVSEEKTDNREQQDEYDSTLSEMGEHILNLEADMRRQEEGHASVLKQKEDDIESFGTMMRSHQEECELELKEKKDDITALKDKSSWYVSALQRHADEQATLDSTINDLNNFIKEQGSSIATLNSQLSEKAKIIQDNEKRIRELKIESQRFQTAAKATQSSSVSRIALLELEQAKECERAIQDYWRKCDEMERNHRQELMEMERNANDLYEGYKTEAEKQRKESKAMEEQYKNEVDKLKKKNYDLESEKRKSKTTLKELQKKNNDYLLKKSEEAKCRLEVQIESQRQILRATTKCYDSFQAEAKQLKETNGSMEQYLQQREEKYRQEFENLKSEITRLTLRLSKIASAKMTTGNSSIADLSDVFRPTKISELFSELYDNQWTDAFDQLTKDSDREERDAILLLLEILQESYNTCVSTTQSHLQGVKDAMCNFNIQATQEPVSQENNVTKVDLEVPDESWKMIMDFHKAAAYGSKGEIAKIISCSQMESRGFRNMDKVGDYMQTCAEICWLMAVQDPPVVVDVLDVPPGCQRSFNKDRYRAYTRTGKFYDFTVWPALLLQKDGPILCKGVAQGSRKMDI